MTKTMPFIQSSSILEQGGRIVASSRTSVCDKTVMLEVHEP